MICFKEQKKKEQKQESKKILKISGNTHAKFFKQAAINNQAVKCYVDLGSEVTTLRKDCAGDLRG